MEFTACTKIKLSQAQVYYEFNIVILLTQWLAPLLGCPWGTLLSIESISNIDQETDSKVITIERHLQVNQSWIRLGKSQNNET